MKSQPPANASPRCSIRLAVPSAANLISTEGTSLCDFPASRRYEHPRSAYKRDRSRPDLAAASAEVQASVAHPPPDLMLTCDGSVSMRATFVMSW